MNKKRPLTSGEWAAITDDCRECYVSFKMLCDALWATNPVAVGDRWSRLRHEFDGLADSTVYLESFDRGHRRFEGDARPTASLNWIGASTINARNHARPLTRAEWVVLGDLVKDIHRRLTRIGMTLQVEFKLASSDRWFKLSDKVDRLKSDLDGLVAGQHPDWDEFAEVFYGPKLDENEPLRASVDPDEVARLRSITPDEKQRIHMKRSISKHGPRKKTREA
jgi:hypothetical protein